MPRADFLHPVEACFYLKKNLRSSACSARDFFCFSFERPYRSTLLAVPSLLERGRAFIILKRNIKKSSGALNFPQIKNSVSL